MDVMKILEHYDFDTSNFSGDIVRTNCKIHGGTNKSSFVIDVSTGLWFCHSGCGGGDIFTLIERMEDMSFPQAVEFLANFFDVDTKGLKTSRNKDKVEKELKSFMKAMKRSHTSQLEEFEYNVDAVGISRYRNFSKETLDRFKVIYAKSVEVHNRNNESYTIYDRVIVPVVFRDKNIGISIRKTKEKDFPKWLHQPPGIKFNEVLYNYDSTLGKNEVIVVEGMFDVFAFYEIGLTAVCTFGAHLTHQQYVLLLQTGADIILAYDGDKAGRTAQKKAIDMLKNKANLFKIEFNPGQDPANITREELLELYAEKKRA